MRPPSFLHRLIDRLLTPALDFAALKFRDEAGGHDPYRSSFGDVPGTADLKSFFHAEGDAR